MPARRALLFPTPRDRMVDADGRPYFLWDLDDVDLETFRARITSEDEAIRAYWIAKLMRQAKPDDVFSFVSLSEIAGLWPSIERHLGRTRDFWRWLLRRWQVEGVR